MAGFLDDLAERADAFTFEETAVARACFKALLAGSKAAIPDMLSRLDMPAETGTRILAALQAKGVLAVDADGVTVVRGLSLWPTPHRLQVNEGPTIYACCAVDAIGIPAALGADARVTSRCHACGGSVAVAIAAGRVVEAPAAAIIWAADADRGRSLREYTWPLVNFYCSVEHLEAWLPGQTRSGRAYTLTEVAEAGPTLWGAMR